MALLIHSPEIAAAKIAFSPKPDASPRNRKSFSVLRSGVKLQFGATARTGVKDSELGVFGKNQNLKLYSQFSAPVKKEPTESKEEEEKRDYYLNLGYAIRSLREDFPGLFCRELSFDVYRDDIVFKDPLNTFTGIDNYKSIFWALRFYGRIFFRALWVDIISISQPMDGVIMVRWTIHGVPRILWESSTRFDGLSEYKLDKHGKIFQHRVDNIAFNSPPKFKVLAMEELIQSVTCPTSTPKPTYFEVQSPENDRRVQSKFYMID